jgi:hypothetical protein
VPALGRLVPKSLPEKSRRPPVGGPRLACVVTSNRRWAFTWPARARLQFRPLLPQPTARQPRQDGSLTLASGHSLQDRPATDGAA